MASIGGVRGILFDKDGTLLDFDATWASIGEAMALEAANGDPEKASALLVAAGFDASTRRFVADSVFAAGSNADIIALWYPDRSDVERRELLARFDRFSTEFGSANPVPLPGIAPALARLHGLGLKLAIATNDSTGGAEASLSALGIAHHFHAVYGYDSVANPKPAADIVHAFCDFTGLKPSDLAMVGDNRHDLEMGRSGRVGLVVGVLSGTGTRETLEPLADLVVDSVADLPDLLATRGA